MKTTVHRIQAHWTSPSGFKRARVVRVIADRKEAEKTLQAYADAIGQGWRPVKYKEGEATEISVKLIPSTAEFYCIKGGEVIDSPLTRDQIIEAASRDDYIGLCTACGDESTGIEPDAQKCKCDNCGEYTVFGAEELVIRIAD